MNNFKEYDIVVVLKAFENVPKGSIGTVLIATEGVRAHIVEFVDSEGNHLNTLEVKEMDIQNYDK